jgi:hypothetical protein
MEKKVIKIWYQISIIEIIKIINWLMEKNREIIILLIEITQIKVNHIIHY